jgi:pantoate--beta-alanine ligase
VAGGETEVEEALAAGRAQLESAGVALEYLALVDPASMEPLERVEGDALAVIAAVVGSTRLIDNRPLTASAQPAGMGPTPRNAAP